MYSLLSAEELGIILSYTHNLHENTLETTKNEHGSFLNTTLTDIIGSIIVDYAVNQRGLLDALTDFSECVDSDSIVNFEYRKNDDDFGIELLQALREEKSTVEQNQKGMYTTLTSIELKVVLNFIHRQFATITDHAYNERNFHLSFSEAIGSIITDYACDESGLLDAMSEISESVDSSNIINFNNRKGDDAFGIEFLQVLREEITMMEWAEKHGNDDYYFPKYSQIEYLCRVIGSNDYDTEEEFYAASSNPDFSKIMESYLDSPGFEEFCKINGCAGHIEGGEPIIPIIVSRIILGGVQ